jgi:hypothetical protein
MILILGTNMGMNEVSDHNSSMPFLNLPFLSWNLRTLIIFFWIFLPLFFLSFLFCFNSLISFTFDFVSFFFFFSSSANALARFLCKA